MPLGICDQELQERVLFEPALLHSGRIVKASEKDAAWALHLHLTLYS